ncbi:ferrous iron transport protein A [Arcobacter acticola]|jgi:ferrous iron transport protein A|uniref:Ferrous iron transport protein A n=1 Tax=Arcobacter acticola TaxID=1849015 RepID=A0A6M8EY18_9BACT|nr:FeoA family protein [Arcobacter acticola]QKE29437.1 ferrous iron transport protein A [Arcobacter acticola]
MTLNELKIKESAEVISINCDKVLKNRLYSFGIIKGAIVKIEELTLTKSTIEIKINQSKIALRLSEAEKIEVKYA